MAKVIDWNNVSIPSFADSNTLIREANQGYANAGELLAKTAQGYQDAIRKRNTGLIQDYINSARTPEELQSEAFQVGYQNLVNTLAKEYDPVAMNQYKDSRGDVLTKRASDALSLKRNQFGLEQEQKLAPINLEVAGLNRDKLNQAIAFDADNNPLTLRTNRVAANIAEDTAKDKILNAKLVNDNILKQQEFEQQRLNIQQQEANARALEARARQANSTKFDESIGGIFTNAVNNIATNEANIASKKAEAMSDFTKGSPKAWLTEKDPIVDKVPSALVKLLNSDFKDLAKNLTPSQQAQALDLAYSGANLGSMVYLSDKGNEILKTNLEKSLNAVSRGEQNAKTAYNNAQIDNAIREVRARYIDDPTLTDERILDAMRLNSTTKDAYLEFKGIKQAKDNVVKASTKEDVTTEPKYNGSTSKASSRKQELISQIQDIEAKLRTNTLDPIDEKPQYQERLKNLKNMVNLYQ